ncbi:MAG: hypothetical protein G01um101466_537 [Parcubacteria group bacterium Gr01-1014_66]|nr:MAG: hypothetical protein G01um101466_537 [Parcubacteria group bacterium Gr01-1014_66]
MIHDSKKNDPHNAGIIQLLIIIILSVIILSLLGVSLRTLLTDQTLTENFIFLWDFVKHAWGTYVWPYLELLWQKIERLR